ncbi:carboxypeptidase-like regulatory domain-containing protein [Hymenobacter ginkgonis]|nr:carboxypeptidase-like regulatory domain-containing protein [Hymenobacter ginkgonis]
MPTATASQTVTLRGIVSMPTGQPQPGASVYVAGAARQLVVTDAQGAFALPVPAGAAVSLRIEYFGEGISRMEVPTPTAKVLHITLGQ